MKKSILWGIIAIVFIVGGGGIFLNEQHQHSTSQPAEQTSSKKVSRKSSSLTSSSAISSSAASSSSKAASSTSAADSSSKDINNTGNAGKQGAGKMGDHTVNGKEVDQETIENVKKKLKSLGYNPASWSPQDIINLYRYASNQGHDTPDKITKDDVNGYLK